MSLGSIHGFRRSTERLVAAGFYFDKYEDVAISADYVNFIFRSHPVAVSEQPVSLLSEKPFSQLFAPQSRPDMCGLTPATLHPMAQEVSYLHSTDHPDRAGFENGI